MEPAIWIAAETACNHPHLTVQPSLPKNVKSELK